MYIVRVRVATITCTTSDVFPDTFLLFMSTRNDQHFQLAHVLSVHVVGEPQAVAGRRFRAQVDFKRRFRVGRNEGGLDVAVRQ